MAYSLGLTLYNIARRGDAQGGEGPWPQRPAGRLIWLHAPDANNARPMAALARRIRDEDGHNVVLTGPEPGSYGAAAEAALHLRPPPDTTPEVLAFLDHWRPDCVMLSGGEVRPALISAAAERRVPLAMVNARAPFFPTGRDGWWPGLMRGTLAELTEVHAIDGLAARGLRKAGAIPSSVIETGRLEDGSAALPCNEAERASLARLLGSRPVWLAADLTEAEEAAVLAAHRSALRLAHRLLLIVVPADPARAEAFAARAEAEGLIAARRGGEEEPESDVEVYVAEQSSEYGLWYRLAPITFLGGSLSGRGCLRNPMEAAALGSALIHGPKPGAWGAIFGRLGAARAARPVATTNDLAEAVSDLLAPDRAARLAGAAWAVASDGVEATERALMLVRRLLGEA
jgi:3-deoxy-D-manno-octulosonic-acid transferase